jgi:hypothetical protein
MIAAAVFSLLIADLRFAYKHPTASWGTGAMGQVGVELDPAHASTRSGSSDRPFLSRPFGTDP